MEKTSHSPPAKKRAILWRGIRGRCPHCGQGRLFNAYLRQAERCSVCDEDIGAIRADDGPAWLTILVTGHLLAPLVSYLVVYDMLPVWMTTGILLAIGLLLVFSLLQPAKGLFIAAIWLTTRKDAAMR